MDTIWTVLGLEPTRDIPAIKQAYAQKTRTCHPEEDPEGFLRLRKAYQAALDCAERGADRQEPPDTSDRGGAEDGGWTLSGRPAAPDEGPNPFQDHAAIRSFLDLYTGRQRQNAALWLDYFTSGPFLDAAWNRRFTALLLEHVRRLEEAYPAPREFLSWLCAAYQCGVSRSVYQNPDGSERTEFQFQIPQEAQFDGQEAIFEIIAKGPALKSWKKSGQAVSESFREYRRLCGMAELGRWNEEDLTAVGKLLEFYTLSNLSDRKPTPTERHPAGTRLIAHFFLREDLPEELYRIAWQKLDLKSALMGRAKLLYGGLRARVLAQVPHAAEDDMDFRQLNKDYDRCRWSLRRLEESGSEADLLQAEKEAGAFFARADFQSALQNRRFVEDWLLRYWLNPNIQWGGSCFARRVRAFYEAHPEAPCARQAVRRIQEAVWNLECLRRTEEDRNTPVSEARISLSCRPFLRHWLNTGFQQARDLESGRWLREYLNQALPYLPDWSRRLLAADGEHIAPAERVLRLGEDVVSIRFHLRYMEFLRNRRPVYRACLDWERVAGLADTDAFFFLLPITAATYDHYEAVKAEILRRLADTAAPEDVRAVTAACLAEQVCRLPVPGEAGQRGRELEECELPEPQPLPAESVLPFELFAEDTEHLYGCAWNERKGTLLLFEQLPNGRQLLKYGLHEGVEDAETAEALAKQLLAETLCPPGIPLECLASLPDAVYSMPDFSTVCRDEDAPPLWSTPVELLGEAVTAEKLEALLELFFSGRTDRLELSWRTMAPLEAPDWEPRRSLLFIKDGGQYACLYFDDFRAESYALLENPELYRQGAGAVCLKQTPFRRGRLFSCDLHRNPSSIRRKLDVILQQASRANCVKAEGIWDHAVNVFSGRHKYYLDKQLLGDFPMERACSRTGAPFYFSSYPSSAACVDDAGGMEVLEAGNTERPRLQRMLARFLEGGCAKLRLTWGQEPGRRRHIVLLQDGGRFLMVWLLEEKRSAAYHVADVKTYLDVEGKKYPKDTFQGRITPAYLIHHGPTPLRNALELLLANIENPSIITGKFAEYAGEKPVKPRPYEVLWRELAGDTLEEA